MGRSRQVTDTFRVEYTLPRGKGMTPSIWDKHARKALGRPTQASLKLFVNDLLDSCKPGGCNEHLSELVILEARVVHKPTGETRFTYNPVALVG